MLKNLTIKNYALLDEVQVQFGVGLNVITGETGAGKSILIDALSMILGEKSDVAFVRSGADKAVIEGEFSIDGLTELASFLQKSELDDEENDLIIRREIHSSGRSRAFVNDTPVPVNTLIHLGDLLVDLHGQHEHQALLKVKEHLGYLDAYGQHEALLTEVQNAFNQVQESVEALHELQAKQSDLQEKRSLLVFQLKEIDGVNPGETEEEELEKEERLLRHSEKLHDGTSQMYTDLYEGEGAVTEKLHRISELLSELGKIDEYFGSLSELCQTAQISIEEIAKSVQSYQSRIDFSSTRLEDVRTRLSQLAGLKKKFGGSMQAVMEHWQYIKKELNLLENVDEQIKTCEQNVAGAKKILTALCVKLSTERKKAAAELERIIGELLKSLGMPQSKFVVTFSKLEDKDGFVTIDSKTYKTTPKGLDHVEFFLSANPGEEPRQLIKIASGGEISRIMLALKTALAKSDHIPVLIFDEIDIGISGRIAQVVGRSLQNLAHTHQILCITHLPQIASMGHQQYLVEKQVEDARTRTHIHELNDSERPHAIARLLGGKTITDVHLEGAKQLLTEAQRPEK